MLSPEGVVIGGPKKLSIVVEDALKRWYAETEREALRGDLVRGGGEGCSLDRCLCAHDSREACGVAGPSESVTTG